LPLGQAGVEAEVFEASGVYLSAGESGMSGSEVMGQRVGNMDRNDWGEAADGGSGGAMMESDGFDNRGGQSPEPQEIGADLGVSSAELGFFHLPNGLAGITGGLGDLGVEFGVAGGEDEVTDIMEQAGQKALVVNPGAGSFGGGDAAGQDAGGPAMTDDLLEGE